MIFCVFCSIFPRDAKAPKEMGKGPSLTLSGQIFIGAPARHRVENLITIAVCGQCRASARGRQGASCADVSALQSISWVATLRASIFGLTNWICFGDEAADDLFQTSIDPARRMRAFFRTVLGEMTWRLEP